MECSGRIGSDGHADPVVHAREMARRLIAIHDRVPVPVFAVLRGLGVRVAVAELGNVSGFVASAKAHGPVVVLNAREPISRRRFSAAHECWHVLCMQAGVGAGGAEDERRADAFASELLMPEAAVRSGDLALGLVPVQSRVAILARRFRVSTEAMRRRYTELGL